MNINIGERPHIDGVDNPDFYQFCLERSKAMHKHNDMVERKEKEAKMELAKEQSKSGLGVLVVIVIGILLMMKGCGV